MPQWPYGSQTNKFTSIYSIAKSERYLYAAGVFGLDPAYNAESYVLRLDLESLQVDHNWDPGVVMPPADATGWKRLGGVICRGAEVLIAGDMLSAGGVYGHWAVLPELQDSPQAENLDMFAGQSRRLVICPGARDALEVSHFYISELRNLELLDSPGGRHLSQGDFVTRAQAASGLVVRSADGFLGRGEIIVKSAIRPDAFGVGGPDRTIIVSVRSAETNNPPELATTPRQWVSLCGQLSVFLKAVDYDVPAQTLTFGLGPDAPAGTAINPATGRLTWNPELTQTPGTYLISVTASDNGTPPLSSTNSVTVDLVANDLGVRIVGPSEQIELGGNLTNIITVTQCGDTATQVTATNFLPESVAFISGMPSQGTWALVGQRVEWNVGALSGSASATLAVVTHPNAEGSITNLVSVGGIEGDGYTATNTAVAVITAISRPAITRSPPSQNVLPTDNLLLEVGVSGTQPLQYQWRKDGTNLVDGGGISGANSAVLAISRVVASDAGRYSLIVSNPYGFAVSSEATVSVSALDHFGWGALASSQFFERPFMAALNAYDAANQSTPFSGPVVVSTLGPVPKTVGGLEGWSWQSPLNCQRMQVIYLADEIGASGPITTLSINVYRPPTDVLTNYTIRMKHTSSRGFLASRWDDDNENWTVVYQTNLTVVTDGSWVKFQLSKPFDYNGVENLMLDFSFHNPSYVGISGEFHC